MPSHLKTLLHVIGSALGLFGIVFVAIQLNAYSEQIDLSKFNAAVWFLVILLAMLYAAASVMLVQAWLQLLGMLGITAGRRWALKTYGMSQLAKYVPGNIFHLAGRQALGLAAGLPGFALAKSVVWELGLFACAGAFFGGLAMALIWTVPSASILIPTFVTISVGAVVVLRQLLSPAAGTAFAWQLSFLSVSSAVFVGVLEICAPLDLSLSVYIKVCAVYVLAWLAGFVTPGAPAGVGIRELVILFMLRGEFAESDLLLSIVLGRCVTVLGDFLFFILAYMVPNLATTSDRDR